MFQYLWNLQQDISEFIHRKEIDSQIQKTNLQLAKGKEGGARIKFGRYKVKSLGLQIQPTIFKPDEQQGPTIIAENNIQYAVINHNEKESEKEYIYMYLYIQLTPFALHQKLTKLCKLTILQ